MTWTKLDRDAVSAEGRELGAFAGRRVVDNIDALARERLPGVTMVIASVPVTTDAFMDRRIASCSERHMPMFVPMPAEAHTAKVVLQAKASSFSHVVNVNFAVGLPGGGIGDTATELPVFGSLVEYEYELDLAEIQRTGSDFLPLVMQVKSDPSSDPAESVNVNLFTTYGDQTVGAYKAQTSGFDGNYSFFVTIRDSTAKVVFTGLGPLQSFYNADAVGAGTDRVYYVWPQIRSGLAGPQIVGNSLDLTMASSIEITSIRVDFESDTSKAYYSPRAMPTQQRTESAQLQVSSSMPIRTSPEHAMLASQDYLLASRPAIYGAGPQTAENIAYLASATASNSDTEIIRVPLRDAQEVNQLDGTDGYVRAFEVVLGVIGVAADGDTRDIIFTADLKAFTLGSSTRPAPETVLSSTDVTYTVAFDSDTESYARNVISFSDDRIYPTGIRTKHQLHGLFPSWEWYRNRMTIVRIVVEADPADPRADFLDVSVRNANSEDTDWHLYSTTWFVRDLPGAQWQTKVKAQP